jgi:hypothetical protein
LIVAVILLLGVVGGLIWIFTSGNDVDPEISVGDESVVEQEGDTDDTLESEEIEFEDVEVDSSVTYSKTSKTVGSVTDTKYDLEDINIKKGNEVLDIELVLRSVDQTDGDFQLVVGNNSVLGVLDIKVSGVSEYSADLSYEESIDINYEGISTFTKVIESVDEQERFYLGCSGEVDFYVYDYQSNSDGSITAKITVKYPGGEIVSLDSGSKDFTSEDISFDGNDVDGGAKVIDYDYIYSNGSLKFNLQVSSTSDIVIPSFESSLDSGTLVVTFPSLSSDSVFTWDTTLELPRGVNLAISRTGSVSTYTFTGVGSTYRVFGESNPNQVVIDMSI